MQLKLNKRSRYGPIRYEATRPYAVTLGKTFVAHANRGEAARLQFLNNEMIPLLRSASASIGKEKGPGPLQAEVVNVQVFGGFHAAGKVIFDITPGLFAALAMTDSDAIPCGEVPIPCDSFFIHFGDQDILSDEIGNFEGAFVTKVNGRLCVDLIKNSWGQSGFMSSDVGQPLIGISVDLTDPTKPLPQALSDSIDDVIQKNESVLKQVADIEAQLYRQYGQVVKVPSPVHSLMKRKPLLTRALSIIANILFYLECAPEDVTEDWGGDTPHEAKEALAMARSTGEAKTLGNTLTNAGYRKVRWIGRKFSMLATSRELYESLGTGKTLATHFRRGHIRPQAHGPQNSLRKLVFIAPVMVNAGKGDVLGRVYQVE